MPKIQEYTPQVPAPLPSPRMVVARPGDGPERAVDFGMSRLSHAAASVNDVVAKQQEDDARAWSSNQLSQAKLDWTQQLVDRQQQFDPGTDQFTPPLLNDFDEYASKAIGQAPTPVAKRYLTDRLNAFRDELGQKAMVYEAQAKVDWRTDQFTAAIDNSKKLMNTDPTQFDSTLAERLAEIDTSSIPPIQKSALRQKAISGIAEAAVSARIQQSPTQFLNDIGFLADDAARGKTRKAGGDLQGVTGDHAFDLMTFERRNLMIGQAVQMKNQLQSDADAAAGKMQKIASDNAAKELWGMHADGKLTRSAIEAYRPVLSVPEYSSFLTALQNPDKPQKTDPAALRTILQMQATDPASAEQQAYKYHKNGLLSNSDLTGFVDRNRTFGRQEGPKSPYEQWRNYITTSMAPSPMIKDPIGQGRLADAHADFDKWWDVAGHKLPVGDVEKYARDVTHRYKMIDLNDTVMALAQPRFGAVRRNAMDPVGITSDVKAAMQATQARRDSKAITPEEYNSEVQLLSRWKSAAEGVKK